MLTPPSRARLAGSRRESRSAHERSALTCGASFLRDRSWDPEAPPLDRATKTGCRFQVARDATATQRENAVVDGESHRAALDSGNQFETRAANEHAAVLDRDMLGPQRLRRAAARAGGAMNVVVGSACQARRLFQGRSASRRARATHHPAFGRPVLSPPSRARPRVPSRIARRSRTVCPNMWRVGSPRFRSWDPEAPPLDRATKTGCRFQVARAATAAQRQLNRRLR